MKQYIATFRVLNAAFNTNDIETMWISASTKAHAIQKAKFYANEYGNKFISIRAVESFDDIVLNRKSLNY